MKNIRRRELLALAALPLQSALSHALPQKPLPDLPPIDPDPPKTEVEMGSEIPEGAIAPLSDGPFAGMRWSIRYQYDKLEHRCRIQDFSMPTPAFGLASMLITKEDSNRLNSLLLISRDNGRTWVEQATEKNPLGVFVLDEAHAWVVTPGRILSTVDAGVKWEQRILPDPELTQVWFDTEKNGWAFGRGKTFYVTHDGGRLWTPDASAEKVELKSPETYLRSMGIMPSGVGILAGDSTARAPEEDRLPDWMTPEHALRRKEVPGTLVIYETHDHGATWTGRLSSGFGHVHRVRMAPGRAAVTLQYMDSFLWPSEALEVDLRTSKTRTVLRRKEVVIHDALVLKDGSMVAACIQPRGRLRSSPIPGKVRIFWSPDTERWVEMKVDYRASGHELNLSLCSDGGLWAATDEGCILQLSKAS
jgi:hypothetical protein